MVRSRIGPALVLCETRPFGDLLVCGISTQLHLRVQGFDELLIPADPDFSASGLAAPSLIRLAFITTVPLAAIKGEIGAILRERYERLLKQLAEYFSDLSHR